MTELPKQGKEENNDFFPNFEIHFSELKKLQKPLTLKSTRQRQQQRIIATSSSKNNEKIMSKNTENLTENSQSQASIVTFTDEELNAFKQDMAATNTKKSTASSVRRFKSWYEEKYGRELDLDKVSKQNAPQLLKFFFLEIRQTTKENKGKVYEPGILQTYRNGLRRYFLERPCPPAVDNFDIEKTSGTEFGEVSNFLALKKKDLKKKGLGNKPNAAEPVEKEDIENMWSSGAIGLSNPRSLLHLVWWTNVTHLCMLRLILNNSYLCVSMSVHVPFRVFLSRVSRRAFGVCLMIHVLYILITLP
jgi:hypothetical protein